MSPLENSDRLLWVDQRPSLTGHKQTFAGPFWRYELFRDSVHATNATPDLLGSAQHLFRGIANNDRHGNIASLLY